jgi:hypothetical protein
MTTLTTTYHIYIKSRNNISDSMTISNSVRKPPVYPSIGGYKLGHTVLARDMRAFSHTPQTLIVLRLLALRIRPGMCDRVTVVVVISYVVVFLVFIIVIMCDPDSF